MADTQTRQPLQTAFRGGGKYSGVVMQGDTLMIHEDYVKDFIHEVHWFLTAVPPHTETTLLRDGLTADEWRLKLLDEAQVFVGTTPYHGQRGA